MSRRQGAWIRITEEESRLVMRAPTECPKCHSPLDAVHDRTEAGHMIRSRYDCGLCEWWMTKEYSE